MPLRRSTREFLFINTSNPDERTFLLKTLDKIKELPDNSTDIESDNIITRYQRRPRKLEELCLANFVAWFNCVKDKHSDDSSTSDDPVAPNTQHINEQDAAAKTKPSELFGCFDPGTNKQHSQYDLFDYMGILLRHNDEEELVQNRLNDSDYRQLVRSLNIKQKEFFYHVLHSIKTKDDPLALFLSGGAGVGKSTVTNALYEGT